jgi:hypothetical protein
MLVDVLLLCAPLVVALPAVIVMLRGDASLASKGHLQKRLYATLLMAEKLPMDARGAAGIARDIDRQTLGVAYVAQYPRRARELSHVALVGALVVGGVGAYYVSWWRDATWLVLLVVLGVVAVAALLFERAMLNFERNDVVARELFEHFDASPDLLRPPTDLAAKVPALSIDEVFRRAADVRDAEHGESMTTLAAVNAALAKAHAEFDWRRAAVRLVGRIRYADYLGHARSAVGATLSFTARAYDWLLRHLLGPFFSLRLALLDHRERLRTTRAQRRGDVFGAAWLPTHYRNERTRLEAHWAQLHKPRDPLLRWSGHGVTAAPRVDGDEDHPAASR